MKSLLFDLETTGLLRPDITDIEHQPRIIEIYMVLLDTENDYSIIDSFESFVNPGIRLPANITRHTGITRKHLRDAPRFKEIFPEVLELLNRADNIVAHNAMFDAGVLEHEFTRMGYGYDFPEILCTIEHTEFLFGKRPTMSALYTFITKEKPPKGIHRAIVDVGMLKRVFIELHKNEIMQ